MKFATLMSAKLIVSGTPGEIGGPALKHAARAPPQGQKQGKGKSRPSQRELGKNARQFRRTLQHVVSGLSVLLTVIGRAGKRRVFAGMSGTVLTTRSLAGRNLRGSVWDKSVQENSAGPGLATLLHMRLKRNPAET